MPRATHTEFGGAIYHARLVMITKNELTPFLRNRRVRMPIMIVHSHEMHSWGISRDDVTTVDFSITRKVIYVNERPPKPE
jgi:hypothetical protein